MPFWQTGIDRSTDLVNWEQLALNPVRSATDGGLGFDGPEMLYVGDDLFIYYYRDGAKQTVRGKLVLTMGVAEPSTLILLGLGGAALVAVMRRRRRR